MVVFTCNHCGESLQKPRVEKHYNLICKTTKNLTCVDCLKEFREEEYAVHIKCFTEDERYGAKGSLPNGIIKKGEKKQESWMEMIHSIINEEKNIKLPHRNLLNSLSGYNNVPRKKAKFINFVKNSTGGRANIKDIEAVWDYIEKYKLNNSTVKNGNSNEKLTADEAQKSDHNVDLNEGVISEDGNAKSNKKKKSKESELIDQTEQYNTEVPPKKKRKMCISNTENEETDLKEDGSNEVPKQKFDFRTKILELVQTKGTISLKKLEKKIVKLYLKEFRGDECPEKILKKYNKKLKKIEEVEIEGDTIKLVT